MIQRLKNWLKNILESNKSKKYDKRYILIVISKDARSYEMEYYDMVEDALNELHQSPTDASGGALLLDQKTMSYITLNKHNE
jgi:hypothetical protein